MASFLSKITLDNNETYKTYFDMKCSIVCLKPNYALQETIETSDNEP